MADWIPGINVGNAFKQIGSIVGLAPKGNYDVLDNYTSSNRAGQTQVNGLPDITTKPAASASGGGGGGGAWGGDTPVQQQGGVSGSAAPSGGGTSHAALNEGAIHNTQLAIDQIPALLQAAIETENTKHANLVNGFNDQEGVQRGTYDKSTVTNQTNYDTNFMDAIRSGIKGLGGLMNLLRGTGAAGGTAEDLVRDTVGGVTSNDIRTGADTRDTNQTSLDSALSTFLTDLKGKRLAADDTLENNKRAIQRDSSSQLQDLFGKMAGYYGDAGQTGQANDFMSRAGALTPEIAKNSMTKQSAYDTTPVAVQAPTLSAFTAPTQPDVTLATPDQVGSGIFTMNRKRQQDTSALPVGA